MTALTHSGDMDVTLVVALVSFLCDGLCHYSNAKSSNETVLVDLSGRNPTGDIEGNNDQEEVSEIDQVLNRKALDNRIKLSSGDLDPMQLTLGSGENKLLLASPLIFDSLWPEIVLRRPSIFNLRIVFSQKIKKKILIMFLLDLSIMIRFYQCLKIQRHFCPNVAIHLFPVPSKGMISF